MANKATIIKMALMGLFLIMSISVIISLFNHGINNIPKEQMVAIREHDLQKAYAMTSPAFQEHTSFDDFKEFVKSYPVLNENKDISFNEIKLENNFGYLSGTIESTNGQRMIIEYQLIRYDNRWKIQALRLSPLDS